MACAKTISKYALSASMVIFEVYKQLSFFLEHLISNLKYMEMDQVFLRDLYYYALCFIFKHKCNSHFTSKKNIVL